MLLQKFTVQVTTLPDCDDITQFDGTSLRCTSLEIKGTSTLHSLCSTFISTVDCLEDVGLVISEQWGLIVQEQDIRDPE
jgi:hypothetical protein